MASVDHPHRREAVRIFRDVDEITAGNQRSQNGGIDEDVLIIEIEDPVEVEQVAAAELPETEPVREAVNSLSAPSERPHHPAQGRRSADAEVCDRILHVVIVISEVNAGLLDRKLVLQICHAFQFAHIGSSLIRRTSKQSRRMTSFRLLRSFECRAVLFLFAFRPLPSSHKRRGVDCPLKTATCA